MDYFGVSCVIIEIVGLCLRRSCCPFLLRKRGKFFGKLVFGLKEMVGFLGVDCSWDVLWDTVRCNTSLFVGAGVTRWRF